MSRHSTLNSVIKKQPKTAWRRSALFKKVGQLTEHIIRQFNKLQQCWNGFGMDF